MKKVIITGSTGMIGKGVLLECLDSSDIEKVLVINRNPINVSHYKLEEVLLPGFGNIANIKHQLAGYDACFFCLGISAVGTKEEDYNRITFEYTKVAADVLYDLNPNMVFNFVSGQGTDSTETSRTMWARVKGKAENYVFGKGFKDAYAFRPGMIIPERGIKSRTKLYRRMYVVMSPIFPLLKKSKGITTTTKIGQAMINVLSNPIEKKYLDNKTINNIADMIHT